ncbi:MAG: flagellar basal body P-ring formation chaperone FlgA [Planctomycetota bacterium]|nr:flagellar basal body P-ring formation chaperone FlgA [Planctomycetota bacterium]
MKRTTKQTKTTASRIKLWAFMSVLGMGGAAWGDMIELKSAVRLEAGDRVVTLGDIAELHGPEAEALAHVVVAEIDANGNIIELPVRQIRGVLDEHGVHWGRIQLNGRKVVIRPGRPAGMTTLKAMQGAAIDKDSHRARKKHKDQELTARDLILTKTFRGSIARFMTDGLQRRSDEIRIAFEQRDDEFLDRSLDTFRIEIQPMGTLLSDRLGLNIRLWNGARIVERRTITIGLMVRQDVAMPIRKLERHHRVTDQDIRRESIWLKPSEVAFTASAQDVTGRIASRTLNAGEPIAKRTVERETIIRRGDLVTVRCLVGGSVISLQAEARDSGSIGETIEFRKRGERDTFLAQISAPGEAIVDLSRH